MIIGFGIATFVTMSALWVTVPESAYGGGDLDTKLFMIDMERGFRIYMPMYFGVMLILYLNRSAWVRFAWWKLIGIVTGLALMLMIYKQRAAIARALAMEPRILLMDEPFAALDALTRVQMQEELLQLWQETRFTVLFVTHSISEAIRIGTRILVLSSHPGQVKAELKSGCDQAQLQELLFDA